MLDYNKPAIPKCPLCRQDAGPESGKVRDNYINHALAAEKRNNLSEREKIEKRRSNEERDRRRKRVRQS